MKKLNKYIMLLVAALALVSCVDDGIDNPTLKAEAGDEVQFGLSLPSSRTVYGDEANNAYPIYWVNNDKVFIFSPQCLDGHRGAEYAVSVDGAEQNYATSLTKTGEYGVQWGDNATANFYSLYPSGQYGLSDDQTIAKGIVVNTSQNIIVTQNADGTSNVKSDMEDCLLYAKKTGVQSGATVELQYSPITTVFMLTLGVGDTSVEEYTIQSISLTAPEGTDIAGKFGIYVDDGTFAEWGDTKDNIVSAAISDKNTGGYLTLTKGQSIEVPLFIAPIRGNGENGAFSVNGWTIEVKANNKSYYKTLGDLTVVPGQIHKIALPKLSANKKEEWDVATWMVNIPRNVYLSEISIPGTWNSLNPDFQTDLTIGTQYQKGVRAFHLDTRWQREYVVDSWIIEGLIPNKTHYEYTLGVANGGSTEGGSTDKYDNDSPVFRTCLEEIIGNLKTNEYMVLVCSFAQNSADTTGPNGKWYSEISAICDEYTAVYDARNLTPNTVVGDVLGRVIVLVNMPSAISATTALPTDSKCLFTYLPSELTANHFNGTDDNQDDLWVYESSTTTKDTQINIYNNQAQITSGKEDGSGYTTSSRGYAPSVAERTAILNKITTWSKDNYTKTDYAHDQWIYLGLGGYKSSSSDAKAISGSYVAIETEYNSWINDKVDAMGVNNVSYYPVGIVLMNNKNGSTNYTDKTNAAGKNYNFASVVKNILLLNNKYRLQYDPTKPEDYINPDLIDEGTGGSGGSGGDEF